MKRRRRPAAGWWSTSTSWRRRPGASRSAWPDQRSPGLPPQADHRDGEIEMSDPRGDDRHTKFLLSEDQIPRAWYNIVADLPIPPAAVLHPGTGQPIGPADLAPLFPMALIGQEVSTEREIEIPGPVRDAYRLYRPSPLFRAHRLERVPHPPPPNQLKFGGGRPGGQPQAEHRDRTGLLQPAGRHEADRNRDRRRPVGQRPGVRRRPVRPRSQGLHGP